MSAWLDRLEPRERRVMVGGVTAALVIVLAAFVWWPLTRAGDRLAERVQAQAETLAWMQAARRRIESGEAAPTADRGGRSLLALADATAREAGLGDALQRVEPGDGGGVRVWVEGVGFDTLASWLTSLAGQYGLTVTELRIDRAEGARVNARVLIAEGGA